MKKITKIVFYLFAFFKLFSTAFHHGIDDNLSVLKQRKLQEESESSDSISIQNEFKEILTARMGYVPSLLSLSEQEKLTTTLQNIVEEKSNHQFSDVLIQIVRQMIERKRRDDDVNDELVLVLSVSGSCALQDDPNNINVHSNLREQFSSGVIREIRQISEHEPFFTNVTDFKIIRTPKAFSMQSPQRESFNAPANIVVMETTDEDNGNSAGDVAAIVGVCVLTVGLVTLIAIASVFMR